MSGLRILAAALAALDLSLGSVVAASPEVYPARPIKVIVPTPAGGPVDVIARLVGNYLTSSIGQPVVIDNRPGAGNTIGSKEAAQAEPDGYTLLYSSVEGTSVLLPLIRSGKLRALATTSATRIAELPNLPTMIESGFPGFVSTSWTGLLAPARTPGEVIDRLNTQMNEGLRSAELESALAKLSNQPLGGTPQDFTQLIKSESGKWTPIVKGLGLKAD